MKQERKHELIDAIHEATKEQFKLVSLPELLKPYCKRERVFMIEHILYLIKKGDLGYVRTSACFLENPKTGVSWINCKEGSRNEKLFETFFPIIRGSYASHIRKLK